MTNSTRNYLVTFSVLATILALICATYFSMDSSSIMIDGESVHGFAGVGIAAGGVMIGLLAVVLPLALQASYWRVCRYFWCCYLQ